MAKHLFNLPDRNYQYWKSFIYQGEEICFEHLNASKHIFKHPQRNEIYTIFFTFSHHVFTKDKTNGVMYPHSPKDPRPFNLERYELSKYLPDIIATLPEQFCFHGGHSKYCTYKVETLDGAEKDYQVVYRAWKERGKMRFHIESAYPLDDKLGRVKKVNFWSICYNLVRNKKLPEPSK